VRALPFMKLSEKGYERRSERGFGGYRGAHNGPKSTASVARKATQWVRPTLLPGPMAGPSRLSRPSMRGRCGPPDDAGHNEGP
jgi:hypothetical protein